MLTENHFEQQLAAHKAMQERFELIAAITLKYEGRAFVVHDEIQVYVPEGNYEAFLAEVESINVDLDVEVRNKP